MGNDWTVELLEQALGIAWEGLKKHASTEWTGGIAEVNAAGQAMERVEQLTGRKWDAE